MNINLTNLKVNVVDRSMVNVGPSIQNTVRARAVMNQGFGEISGQGNEVETASELDDRDVIDFPYKKIVIHKS